MLFTELRFLPFFLAVFAVHWLLRANSWRKAWLLLASYAFYAAWDWRFLSLIAVSTLVDYGVGLRLGRAGARRKAWLVLSLVVNLGLLGFFKYFDFFVDSAMDLCALFGFQPNRPTLRVILPVGISFYTFQTMSYTIDVYRGSLRPTRNLLDLATFVAFFPQLVAGPIERASHFLPQLVERRTLASVAFRPALMLFLVGFVKKACVSDNLAPMVDAYFAAPGDYGVAAAWAATLAYAIQIYCDFSGYSDMAIACAALLGYRLMENFNFPYFAASITDFWRRWHMSLSGWLRDYLYIPLGGNRGGRAFVIRNVMLTMLLGGLWHGASWNFVLWGGMHGVALSLAGVWRAHLPARALARRPVALLATVLTFLFVCACWVPFRATNLERAWTTLRALAFFPSSGTDSLEPWFWWVFPGLVGAHWVAHKRWLAGWWRPLPGWAFAAVYAVLVALVLPCVRLDYRPFIYFQF